MRWLVARMRKSHPIRVAEAVESQWIDQDNQVALDQLRERLNRVEEILTTTLDRRREQRMKWR